MNILFISYNHSILKLADSIQNHRLIEGLSKEKITIDIIERKLDNTNNNANNVFSISSPDFFFIDRILYKIFPFLRTYFSLNIFVWCIYSYFYIKKKKYKYDVIIVTYEPYCARFLSHWLKKTAICKKLISVLYDPCLDNLFFEQTKIARICRKKMESSILNISDYVVVNNNKVFDKIKFRNKSLNKLRLIPLCASNIIYKDEHKVFTNALITVVHSGNIHGARNLITFNNVICDLKKRIPNLSEYIKFDFYGDCPQCDKILITNCGNDDVVFFYGSVTRDNLSEKMNKANILLLIDPIMGENYSFPSKLCEYFQLKKPIIALTSKDSVSFDLLSQAKHLVYGNENYLNLTDDLYSIIRGRKIFKFNKNYNKQFEVENVVKEYLNLLG